jgi:hypothetical protein
MAERAGRVLARTPLWCGLGCAALLVVTRVASAPRHLFYHDSVNLALALDEFNPAKHQPQPPGYPLFVALARLVHIFVPRPEDALLTAGLLIGLGALLLLCSLAGCMFQRRAGMYAAALLVCNPVFWLGGITSQVRIALALGSTGVAWLAWRAMNSPASNNGPLYMAFAGIGAAAGFRPSLGPLLLPLAVWVWWTRRAPGRVLASGLLMTALASAPWLVWLALSVGGPVALARLLWAYSAHEFSATSAFFGASAPDGLETVLRALAWNGLGALVWIPMLPMALSKGFRLDRVRLVFLAVWMLPLLLFSALIHVADPDQALGTVPAICLAGGALLAAATRDWNRQRFAAAVTAAIAINSLLFFYPPGRLAKAASYRVVAFIDRRVNTVFQEIDGLRAESPLAIVHYGSIVSWRQTSYYYPDDFVLSLPTGTEGRRMMHHRRDFAPPSGPPVVPRGPRRAVLLAPFARPQELAQAGWTQRGLVYYQDLVPGRSLTVGPYQLETSQ